MMMIKYFLIVFFFFRSTPMITLRIGRGWQGNGWIHQSKLYASPAVQLHNNTRVVAYASKIGDWVAIGRDLCAPERDLGVLGREFGALTAPYVYGGTT